jgi:hypothetical protein
MPSLFSMAHPFTAFQLCFVVYVYLLPILLYGVWASLALMDLMDSKQANLLAALSAARALHVSSASEPYGRAWRDGLDSGYLRWSSPWPDCRHL